MEGRQRLAGAFLIELSRIRPDPNQPRKAFADKDQWELAASIEKLGILQPITVQYLESENVYQIITGERRFQAATSLGLPAIPCWVKTPDSQTTLVHQIVENWQRADLHPYDLADALAVLRDSFHFAQKQIAQLTGKPESEISRLLSLLKLNPATQKQARDDKTGTYTRRHLIAIAQLPSDDQQEALIAVKAQNLTALDTEKMVKERSANEHGGKRSGAAVGKKFRFTTAKAIVTIVFRKTQVGSDDLLAALDDARAQINAE